MNNHAIKSGVIVAVLNIVIVLLIYIVDPALMASMWMLILFVTTIGLAAYFGVQHRNEEGGFMAFGPAWIYSIQLFVTAGLVGTIFNILLYNVIDPELPEIIAEQAVINGEKMMANWVPEDQLDEALEKTRTDTLERTTIAGSLKGFAWSLIIYAVFALITGAIIKKKEPEEEI